MNDLEVVPRTDILPFSNKEVNIRQVGTLRVARRRRKCSKGGEPDPGHRAADQ